MTRALAHRGPDGEGIHVTGNVALGHRRLAIIDPEGGTQPMANENGRIWVSYNGEIYNFRELRAELAAKGHRFRTRCDTEVIVHAYEAWGDAFLERLRGMFAFAVVDLERRRLLLARDHFGIKPLFYRQGPGYLGFASELGALRQIEDSPPVGSLQSVDYYLRYQYIPAPHTIYRTVFKLPPAHLLVVDFDGTQRPVRRYWDFRFSPEQGRTDEQWSEEFSETITEAVRTHLVADVPFGVLLSGGNDSTLVAQEMSRALDHPVKAFAMGFENQEYSELEHARSAAERMSVELHSGVTSENFPDLLPRLLAHYGEPFGDSSALASSELARLARQHVPMVLSGDGGDEAFAGYKRYARWFRAMQGAGDSGVDPSHSSLRAWESLLEKFRLQDRRSLWQPIHRDLVGYPCEAFVSLGARVDGVDRVAAVQYADYQTYLPYDILTKVDVASMFHGLEVRTPLVDLRVVELASRLPLDQRIRNGAGSQLIQKYLLKKQLERTFPASFVHRPKKGFSVPRTQWLSPGTAGRRFAEDVLRDPRSPLQEWFVVSEIERCMGRLEDESVHLWLLLVLGVWLSQNPDVRFG